MSENKENENNENTNQEREREDIVKNVNSEVIKNTDPSPLKTVNSIEDLMNQAEKVFLRMEFSEAHSLFSKVLGKVDKSSHANAKLMLKISLFQSLCLYALRIIDDESRSSDHFMNRLRQQLVDTNLWRDKVKSK